MKAVQKLSVLQQTRINKYTSITKERKITMTKEEKMTLMENRLRKLETRKKDNDGVCRRLRREMRNLQKTA